MVESAYMKHTTNQTMLPDIGTRATFRVQMFKDDMHIAGKIYCGTSTAHATTMGFRTLILNSSKTANLKSHASNQP